MEKFASGFEKMIESIMVKLPTIAVGIIILVLGSYLIKIVIRILKSRFEKRDVDLSIRDFISSIVRFVLWAMLILTAASTMGLQTTSFLAVLSAASLAIGLSLQGSLANFAGGVLILLFKPFRVGDAINSSSGANGGIQVTAPNGNLANAVVTNFSNIEKRRIVYTFNIPYAADIQKARAIVAEIFAADSRIRKQEEPELLVAELGDNTVQLSIRAWADKANYWVAYCENYEKIKYAFQAQGIKTPYGPQDIRLVNPPA